MALHPMFVLVMTRLPEDAQDVVERLCKGKWGDVTVQNDEVYIRGRKTVFVLEPEEDDDDLEAYFVEAKPNVVKPVTPKLAPAPRAPAPRARRRPTPASDRPTHCLRCAKKLPPPKPGGGRVRLYCDVGCRRAANNEARRLPVTPVVEPDVEQPKLELVQPEPELVVDPGPPPTEPPRPVWCVRCDSREHYVEDCPQPVRRIKLTEPRHDRVIKEVRPARSEEPRQPRLQPIRVPAPLPAPLDADVTDDTLAVSAVYLQEQWREGLPDSLGFTYLPDVLSLYGVDFDMLEGALRHPQRVEVRPESFDKSKRYPVLSFSRGDLQVILGCRIPSSPAVIAVYVTAKLDHDHHRVQHTGGGSKRSVEGLPTTSRQVVARLRDRGAQVELDARVDHVDVRYRGQELGKISTNGDRATAESDWQRMLRKISAIDQRVTA